MRCKLCKSERTAPRFKLKFFDIIECADCGFRMIPHLDRQDESISEGITDEEIDKFSKYAKKNLEYNRERLEYIVSILKNNIKPKARVLDVGCGSGHFMRAISDEFEAEGIEVSPTRWEFLRRSGFLVHREPIESKYWDASASSFDAVTMWDVIEHVNQPAELAARVYYLLKPNGVFLLDTPSRDGFLYRFGEMTAKITAGRFPTTMGAQYSMAQYGHKQIFRIQDMQRMLKESEFDSINISTKTELSMPAAYYIERMTRSRKFAIGLSPLANALLHFLPLKNKMIVIARKH